MTDQDLLDFVSSVANSVGSPTFATGEAEKQALDFYTSLARGEKVQVHKMQESLRERLKHLEKVDNPGALGYATFILSIMEAKRIQEGKGSFNVRQFASSDSPTAHLPDFEKARLDDFISSKHAKGPRKSTREAILAHQGIIRRMASQKCSTRQISAFLKQEYGVSIAHTTISRNMDLIFKENPKPSDVFKDKFEYLEGEEKDIGISKPKTKEETKSGMFSKLFNR